MKNRTITKLLCAALILILVGGIITVTAAFGGGSLSIHQSRHGIFSLIKWGNTEKSDYASNSYAAENEVIKFRADIDYGSIEIKKGSTFSIKTENINKDNISVSETNGEYVFKVKQDSFSIFGNDNGGTIYVTMPDSVKDIVIDQSLGEVELENLNLTNLEIDSSMGGIEIENVVFEYGDISLSMGSLDFNGDFTKQLQIENNMGDVDLRLMKGAFDYNYDVKVSMGDLRINDQKHGSIDSSYQQNNNKDANLKAKLDMGGIDIEFGIDD